MVRTFITPEGNLSVARAGRRKGHGAYRQITSERTGKFQVRTCLGKSNWGNDAGNWLQNAKT